MTVRSAVKRDSHVSYEVRSAATQWVSMLERGAEGKGGSTTSVSISLETEESARRAAARA